MSLKDALIQIQQEKKEKEITEKIQTMIDEQKRLLGEGVDISKDGEIIKVKKEWNENILTDGGISYYKMNDKWYRVSVCDGDNDVVLIMETRPLSKNKRWRLDRKSTRLNSSHSGESRMPSSA